MKKLAIIFLIAIAAIKGYSQGNPKTDAELKVLFDVIRNEIATGGNTKTRVANAYQALADSKISTKDAIVLSGTNTYSGTVTGLTSYTQFDKWPVQFTNANSGASTVNLNFIGAIALKKNGSSALVPGDVNAGQFFWLVYDGTSFQLIGGGSGGGVGTVTNVTSTSADLIIANGTTTPALTVISAPKWTTARTLNGLSIDGSANVSGVFTAGSTGTGFTIALGTSTKTGTLPLVNGGLETSLSAPASSKILGYDITDATNGYWTVGSNLSYDHATHTLSASGGSGGGVSGLTTNRIPYAANSTTLIDDANMTFDATNKAVTLDGMIINRNGADKGMFFGVGAGNFNVLTVSDGFNIGIGAGALSSVVDGASLFYSSYMTAVGYNAGLSTTNGYYNSFFGYNAGKLNTVGANNSFFGSLAGQANTIAIDNTFIGYGAGQRATTGDRNTGVGSGSLAHVTTGAKNTAVGLYSGGGMTVGSNNTLMGAEAMEFGTGNDNTIMGHWAGVYLTTGYSNVLMGSYAGSDGSLVNVLTTGAGNTFIGTLAGLATTTQRSSSTALGGSAQVNSDRVMSFGANDPTYRPNYAFGSNGSANNFGGGFGMLYIANYTTIPTSAPVGGSFFYSDAGIMKLWNAGAGSGVAIGTGVSFPLSSSQLVINNPAATFAYTFTAQAIGGARTITLPLLAASDEMVTKDFTQTLTNKTLSSNTIGTTQSAGDNSTKLATTAYVDNLTLGPFSTVANGYTNLSGAAGSLLKGDNTWLGIGANTFVLTSNGTTFSWAAASGGGITNAAANTEIPLSNGTNLIASTLFYASRTLTLGTAAAGATITLQAEGSATDVGFNFFNKGAGQFQFNGTGSTLANHFFNQVNSLTVNHYSTNATGVFLVLSKFRGTGASPTTDANGDVLGNLDFQGYDGTSTINSARIKGVLNGTISTGVTPTDIVFQTTATNTVVDAMKISSLGVVSLTGNATQAGELRLYEITGSGTNFSSFKSPALAADLAYTLPNAAAASDGSYMSTTTGGVMSWTEALTPSNGLTTTSTTLKLGGALTANTTISGAFNMTFTTNAITIPSTTITQAALTSGSPTGLLFTGGAHTTLTASTEATDVNFNLARTVQLATGALTTQRAVRIQGPTIGFVGASTITNAYGLWVEPYTAGTNATITSNWAAGFNGSVKVVGGMSVNSITSTGDVIVSTAGNGFVLKEGSNARMGTATANGTTEVTVSTTAVTATSRIFIFCESGCSGVSGSYYISARSAGTSFGFKAAATDTGTVAWILFEPAP